MSCPQRLTRYGGGKSASSSFQAKAYTLPSKRGNIFYHLLFLTVPHKRTCEPLPGDERCDSEGLCPKSRMTCLNLLTKTKQVHYIFSGTCVAARQAVRQLHPCSAPSGFGLFSTAIAQRRKRQKSRLGHRRLFLVIHASLNHGGCVIGHENQTGEESIKKAPDRRIRPDE